MSIPAVGRYLCYMAAKLAAVPGDPALLLAAAYRTSWKTVAKAGGIPANLRPHTDLVAYYLRRYQPAAGPPGPAERRSAGPGTHPAAGTALTNSVV